MTPIKKNNEDIECRICFEPYGKECIKRMMPCGHHTCCGCLSTITDRGTMTMKCPFCRAKHNVRVKYHLTGSVKNQKQRCYISDAFIVNMMWIIAFFVLGGVAINKLFPNETQMFTMIDKQIDVYMKERNFIRLTKEYEFRDIHGHYVYSPRMYPAYTDMTPKDFIIPKGSQLYNNHDEKMTLETIDKMIEDILGK